MGEVTQIRGGEITEFKPEKTKERNSVFAAAIRHAKVMDDWEAAFEAAELMIKEQRQFIAWRDENVERAGGDRQSVKHSLRTRGKLSDEEIKAETGISNQQVSHWRKQIARPGYDARIVKPSHKWSMKYGAQRRSDLQTGEMEWFTPAEYIEAAREVLGVIELDPASCARAQMTVKAGQYYTLEEDGLAQHWSGRVWLNPPFASGLVRGFADKLIGHYKSGDVAAAIMVTNAYTETSWFHNLVIASSVVCFTRGRIKFESPHGEKCAPTNGQSFFYFGVERERFAQVFSRFGLIMAMWP